MLRRVLLLCPPAGCYKTSATMLNPAAMEYPKVEANRVRLFTTFQELDDGGFEYERNALVHGEGSVSDDLTSDHGLMNALRKKVGAIGANAIVNPPVAETARRMFHAWQDDVGAIIVTNPNWE